MLKKFTLLLVVLLIAGGYSYSQVPNPTLGVNEKWTQLFSTSYDYQTNGSVTYLLQDPSNPAQLMAVLMGIEDSNAAVADGRHVFVSYSLDAGATWSKFQLSNVAGSGFPNAAIVGGKPVVTYHVSSPVGTQVYRDAEFGGFVFDQVGTFPTISGTEQPIWPHIAGTSNGNIIIGAAPNANPNVTDFRSHVSTYNGTSWSAWQQLSSIGGPSGQHTVFAGDGGNAAICGFNYSTANTSANQNGVVIYRSNNNGGSWDAGTTIYNGEVIDGTDTLVHSIEAGMQGLYIGTEPHVAFGVYSWNAESDPNLGTYGSKGYKSRILHWSPSTGITQVAGKFNIPNLTDSINNVNVAPLTHVTMGRLANGTLICSFTAYLQGNVQTVDNGQVYNAGEIMYCTSTNNGQTWSTPVNITNTPAIEEKHPSLISNNASSDRVKMTFVRDLKAGSWVQDATTGKAPVYSIYYDAPVQVGIKQTSTQVPGSYKLSQNYPNPFNPTTNIRFEVPTSSAVMLQVFDVTGRVVATLVNNENLNAGKYEYSFDASKLATGVYYYTLRAGSFSETKKMMLIK